MLFRDLFLGQSVNPLHCPPPIGLLVFVFFEQYSTLSKIAGTAILILNQASNEEITLILKYWRITSQVLELPTNLDHAGESQRQIMRNDNDTPYHFDLDDGLARQVQEDLFQDFDRKLS